MSSQCLSCFVLEKGYSAPMAAMAGAAIGATQLTKGIPPHFCDDHITEANDFIGGQLIRDLTSKQAME